MVECAETKSSLPALPLTPKAVRRVALGMGSVAFLAVLLTLADPGLTTDEPLDVRPGRTYVATLRAQGWRFFDRETVDAVFRDNAEHPPLGRWLLGLASTLGEPFEVVLMGGPDPVGLYVLSGRLAPALTFGLLVAVVAATTARRYGLPASLAAGFAILAMPRVFAHAHLGALDTFISAFWCFALLGAVRSTECRRPVMAMAGAGVLWGLALLTKIHAWFLPPLVLGWAWYRLGWRKSLSAFCLWSLAGVVVFVAGWPWLWFHTWARLAAYLGTGVERISIRTLYFGQVYADRDVPWHYPWFYFAVTVPVGLQLLGLFGTVDAVAARQRRRDPFALLLAGSIVLFLAIFSTNIPVYDSERLFLLVFPLWAILVGRGFALAWRWNASSTAFRAGLTVFLLGQGYGVVALHPFGLSYYNAFVGGLPGAERLGLELTYWGDAVDGVLLDRLVEAAPAKTEAALVPTLYPGQGAASTTRTMARRPVVLRDEDAAARAGWLVVSRRTAYWPPGLPDRLAAGRKTALRTRQGVWLSGVWQTKASSLP